MKLLKTLLAGATLAACGLVQAQDIKIANIVELSGPGTTAGTVFKNGVELDIKKISASGGILGKKISFTTEDTQTNPGVAKGLTQKAVDNDVCAIYGPVYSGSIMVSMAESKRGEVPNFTGGEAASITAQGNPYVFRTAFGQNISYPKLAKFITAQYKTLAVIYANNDFGKGGRDTMAKIYLDAIRNEMPQGGGIRDLAEATAASASQLFGEASRQHNAVLDAWSAVGVLQQ